jgi:hypothetical protein
VAVVRGGRPCASMRRPPRRGRTATGFTALLLVLAASGAARGQGREELDRLSDVQVEQRFRFIEERLDRHRLHAELWHWGWTAINGGAVVGLSVAGGLADSNVDRVSYFSQAALAGIGVLDLYFLRPLPARDGAASLRELPAATPAERRERLLQAERLLRRAAARPGDWRDWWPHFGNVLMNTAAGVAVWRAGSTDDALIAGLSGALIGELYIFSQPSGWKEDLRAYRRFTGAAAASGGRWSLVPTAGGLALRYDF